MNETELRTTLLELLNRRPWEPIRVEVVDGRHTFIDNPLKVQWDGNGLVVSRFDAPTAKVPAVDITRLVRIDELPGENGGMSYRDFREVYAKFRHAEPFMPYEVELLDGTRFVVTEPGQLLAGGRIGSYFLGPRKGRVTVMLASVVAVRSATVAEVA